MQRAYTPRQQVRALLILFTVVVVALGGWIFREHQREVERAPLAGTLQPTANTPTAQTWAVGAFAVAWAPSPGALTITDATDPGHVVWATAPGVPFLAAQAGTETVTEARGLIRIEDTTDTTWARQTVDHIDHAGNTLTMTGTLMHETTGDLAPYVFRLEAESPDTLRFAAEVQHAQTDRILLTYACEPNEQFYGFGEQFSFFNLKGRRVPILVREQGLGRGDEPITFFTDMIAGAGGDAFTSYIAVPHYITSAMRSLCLENTEYSIFDLRAPDKVQVKVFANGIRGRIFLGSSPSKLIEAYTRFAGRMRPLPDWILEGAVVGIQGGTEKVRAIHQQLMALDTPIAGYWLQDWVGQRRTLLGKQLWWNWELDNTHYPQWDALRQELAGDGARILTYVNPFLADVSENPRHLRNLLGEASEKGYLVKHADGSDYLIPNTSFSAGLVDLSHPDAYNWLKEVITENLVATGASGWMADFSEALPLDAVLHSGEPAAVYHNRYPEEWARLNREVIDALPNGGDYVFFMRAGYTHSPKYSTLFWEGDQMVSWDRNDGIKSAVTGMLSSGISGFAFNHSDIGGYTGGSTPLRNYYRTRELLYRWMELAAFTPIFRTHEGVTPDENHQFYDDPESMARFAKFAKIYAALAFYRKQLVREAADTGMPMVRHPFLHYPNDISARYITYEQFMLGEDFMIVPVLDPGVTTVNAYLPAGSWTHLWTNRTYGDPESPTRVTVMAPLGEPAVFYKTAGDPGIRLIENLKTAGVL